MISKLNMKVKSQAVVDLVVGRYNQYSNKAHIEKKQLASLVVKLLFALINKLMLC